MANRSQIRHRLRQKADQLYADGQIIEALKVLDSMIGQNIAKADDWFMTGNLLCELGEFAQSIGAYESCLEQHPTHIEARHELGRALYRLGQADRAAKLVEEVAHERPTLSVWAGLAAIAPCVPSYDHEKVRYLRERYAEVFRDSEKPLLDSLKSTIKTGSKLSIGYVSAHFHGQNYMKPVWPAINAHDTEQFNIHLFDDSSIGTVDWHWLRNPNVRTTSIGQLTNREAAATIQSCNIDILVDLSSHSAPKRLGIFVHRPAPIAISWFNQFATGGLHEIDYIVGDATVMREKEERFYTEKFLKLPVSYLTFQTNHAAPEISRRPEGSQFTFGSLGTLYKINDRVLDAWSEILKRTVDSQLLLANHELKSKWNREWLYNQFESRGVSRNKIDIRPPAPHFEFLQYYDEIDLALDTFPYNGGTTTMEAICKECQ